MAALHALAVLIGLAEAQEISRRQVQFASVPD